MHLKGSFSSEAADTCPMALMLQSNLYLYFWLLSSISSAYTTCIEWSLLFHPPPDIFPTLSTFSPSLQPAFFFLNCNFYLVEKSQKKTEGSRWHCTVCLTSVVSAFLTRKHLVYFKSYHHGPCHNLPDTCSWLSKGTETFQNMFQECFDTPSPSLWCFSLNDWRWNICLKWSVHQFN